MSIPYFFIFDTQTGQIIKGLSCSPEDVPLHLLEGTSAIIAQPNTSDADYYIDTQTLTQTLYPTKPSPFHAFDYTTHTYYDPRTLPQLQDAKWEEIKSSREAQLFSPLTALGYTFDADQKGQDNIKGACQIAQFAIIAQQSFSTTFTLADNTRETFTAEQMIQVGLALGVRTEQTHAHAAALREAIYATSNSTQLGSIVW